MDTTAVLPGDRMSHVLRRQWDRYLRIPLEPASRQVKTRQLDRFLGWALLCATHADNRGIPEFSDMHSVSNLLAGEFLVDVHQICSRSGDDDVTELQGYLQTGRGSVILRVLHTIGVQGLSCSQELGELLVSVLPLCLKFPPLEDAARQDMELCHISDCFLDTHSVFPHPASAAHYSSTVNTPRTFSSARSNTSKINVTARTNPARCFSTTISPSGRVTQQKTPGESSFQRLIRRQRPVRHSSGQSQGSVSSTSDSDDEYNVRVKSPFKFQLTSYSALQSNATSPLGVFPGLLGSSATDLLDDDGDHDDDDDMMPQWSPMDPLSLCVLL